VRAFGRSLVQTIIDYLKVELLNLSLMPCFGSFHQRQKAWGIVDRNVGQHFTIEADSSSLQSADELAVRNVRRPAGGVNAHNPKRAEIALLETPSDISIAQCLFHCFLRSSIQLRFREEETLGAAKGFVAIISPVGTSFYSGHVFSLKVIRLKRRVSGVTGTCGALFLPGQSEIAFLSLI
jgi:hypothetical protein